MAPMYMVGMNDIQVHGVSVPHSLGQRVASLSTQVYPTPSPTPQSQEIYAPRAPFYSRHEPSLLGPLLRSWSPWPEIQVSHLTLTFKS